MNEKHGRIYVAPTRENGIEIIDLVAGRTTKIFRRKYQSVPYRERGWEEAFYKANEVPKIKIEQDIAGLFWTGESLWVKTSTTNSNMGDLFDVFDSEGRFLDSFFLGPGRSLLKIIGAEIFVTEKNADESIILVKYRSLNAIRSNGR